MDLKTFLEGIPSSMRSAFADKAETSWAMLTKIAYGHKKVSLGFADVIVAISSGKVTLDELPLAEDAKRYRAIREAHGYHFGRSGKERRTGIRRRADREA
jgi:hypothetical protein